MSKIDDLWAAYYKGQADAERDGILGQAVHYSAGHAMQAMLSVFGTRDEEIAYENGYDGDELELCYECKRVKENCECDNGPQDSESYSSNESDNYTSSGDSGSGSSDYSSSSYSSSDTSAKSLLGCLIVTVVIVGGVILLGKAGMERYSGGKNQEVWTMMGVNTTMLNVRSGPGTDSPVIARFGRGARLATTGDPVANGNQQWVRVSTDDGKVQGWANLKFLSRSPQLQEPNARSSAQEENEANNQSGEAPGESDNVTPGTSPNNSSKLSREKCQELIDRSFKELAVEIPPECDKQLADHYRLLREKHSGNNGRQREW